uniref:Transposase IS200-like domain-containing protein n=1 Tax=Chlorobium phaeobacteroides (strain BS1) TaxID=331678 RepID=B3EP95_CHLPB
MPRGPRLDAPGTLHHVIIRGIGQGRIVSDDDDRSAFVNRMGTVAETTGTIIYAWALLDNHAHLLLKSGQMGLPTYMRKLLSWYAQYYNRRHNRSGHLFQNRYKSIICEEDAYFQKLIAYIHLNPLRAGLVNTLDELNSYPWSGQAAIVGKLRREWQDVDAVLKKFGDRAGTARRTYLSYLEEEAGKGRQPGLVGGGLVRSQGGWSVVKSLRKKGKQAQGDERILGSSEFVKTILDEAEEQVRLQVAGGEKRELVERDIEKACAEAGLSQNEFRSGRRMKPLPEIRNKLAVRFVREYGLSLAETARQLGITTSAVYQILRKQTNK